MLQSSYIYANDTVLLAPAPKAFQTLIDICVSFDTENDVIYNEEKTQLVK